MPVLPTNPPWNIFDVEPGVPMAALLTYSGVSTTGAGDQFPIDVPTGDQEILSGGAVEAQEAAIALDVSVPSVFTFEFTALWENLPPDFASLSTVHSYFGCFAPTGGCVGLFFSKVGLAYTGSVHLDGSNNNALVLDTPVQDLPNSQFLVSENEYWTIRIAVSFTTGATYIYVTKTAEVVTIGHQLRYVMPVIASSSAVQTPADQALILAAGTAVTPVEGHVNALRLGTGVLIPAIPPVADAGEDQAAKYCSIVQLDGGRSFDPQGGALSYFWRLIDAPTGSQYEVDGADGLTFPLMVPTGFTNKFYSATLGVLNGHAAIPAGDVILVDGQAYSIASTGTDGDGFFVVVSEGDVLPDSISSPVVFEYLRQNGLNTATAEKPTFYPDVQGLYKFDLTVFNGSLFSVEPSEIVVNSVDTLVAHGCTPDLSFIWGYLSDFWNQLEDKDRITTLWQGLAQVAAAELLNLWQTDYCKSLRDIQRTFQRRWMHYDLLMQENPAFVPLSTVRAVMGGLDTPGLLNSGTSGIAGTHLNLQLGTLSTQTVITFDRPDPYTPAQIAQILQNILQHLDSRITVTVVPHHGSTHQSIVRIWAPFFISVLSSTTIPIYSAGVTGVPKGTSGSAVGSQTYRVETSLQGLGILPNDFLCIDGVAYRISGLVDVHSDPYPFMRVTLYDALPAPVGATWAIAGTATSSDLDFWQGFCEQSDVAGLEVLQTVTQSVVTLQVPVLGACQAAPASLPIDATAVTPYMSTPGFSVFFQNVLRRKYIPLDPLVQDVPFLQEFIVAADDTQVLRRNVDYFVDSFRGAPCIRFVTPVPSNAGGNDIWQGGNPPAQLWAETTYLDNRPRIESNFGLPAGFTLDDLAQLPSNVDYLSAVQGLWYAYFSGPTVFNLRVGVQILLGLPFAEVTGVVVELRDDFSSTTGRILVQDTADSSIVREYTYPASLALEINPATSLPYALGDTVQQFAPLVTGVEVKDYVNDPTWFQGYLEQGFFFEVEKFFKFLVRSNSVAFNLPALLFAQQFVLRIKPTYTYPLFVTLLQLGLNGDTTVSTSDSLSASATLSLFAGACFSGNLGMATMFDQPNPAGGGWRSQFDSAFDPSRPPTYPTPTTPILWGYDKKYLCPEDFIMGTLCVTFSGPTLPTYDGIFQFDRPVFTGDMEYFAGGPIYTVPGTVGIQVEGPVTVGANGTLNFLSFELASSTPYPSTTFTLEVKKNGTTVYTKNFTTAQGMVFTDNPALSVLTNDVLTVFILPPGSSDKHVIWESIVVEVGTATMWAYDTTLAAGTYCSFRAMSN